MDIRDFPTIERSLVVAQLAVPESWFTDYALSNAYAFQSFTDWARERMENGGHSPAICTISTH